jgi:hypothetical protein
MPETAVGGLNKLLGGSKNSKVGNMNIHLVAIDLDGTLLDTEGHLPPPW